MNFGFTEEQQQVQNLARDIAQKELAPKAAEIDRTQTFPREGLKKLGEVGLMGMGIPHDFGGSKSDTLSLVLAMEEIAKGCASTANILAMHLDASTGIVIGGSEEAKRRYLSSLAKGEKLGAFAATEPGSGCNSMDVETSARADSDYYVVNGTKVFITSGGEADIYMTVVRTNPQQLGPTGLSLLLIEKESPGLSFGTKYERMGFRGISPRELTLTDCRVPKTNLLGAEGEFMKVMMLIGGTSVLGSAAISLGIAQSALEAAVKYAKEKLQAGKQPLTQYQTVKHMLVEMSTAVDAARATIYYAASGLDSGAPGASFDCIKAKLFTSEMAVEVANKALQVHGGTGYCCDLPIERYCRDARGLTLHLPSEMHKEQIAMFLLA
jgi:alkylation response protein AidB-like acyl-CoA dehydrogenase